MTLLVKGWNHKIVLNKKTDSATNRTARRNGQIGEIMDSKNLNTVPTAAPDSPYPSDEEKNSGKNIIPDEVPRKDGPGGEGE